MPRFGPVKRTELIQYLRELGFVERPGSKHLLMRCGDTTVAVPNPHRGDIGPDLLSRVLRQAGVNREQWERL